MIILENEIMSVKVKSRGAELTSIMTKTDNCEYLWQGDPKFWNRHAPVLFPIVGKLLDNQYIYDGNVYSLNQHGFARDMDFILLESTQTKAIFELKGSEEAYKNFPFQFGLKISYTLRNNCIDVSYSVHNADDKTMYFSIGAHPAFNWPLTAGDNYENYIIEFEKRETKTTLLLNNGLLSLEESLLLNEEQEIKLTKELFKNDALIFKDLKSQSVSYKSKTSEKSVTVDFKGFPYLGIWSKPEGAPFICIEPWYGVADTITSKKDISQKEGIQVLNKNESFYCQFSIAIK